MALTSTTVKVQFDGDGSTTVFPVSFVFWDDDDPKVIHTDASDVKTTYARGTNYTVSGGNGDTGSITMVTTPNDFTPASGERLTIVSALSQVQTLEIPAGGPLNTANLEQQLDKNVRLTQQGAEELGRSLKFAEGSETEDIDFPEPSGGKSIRWNTGATALENATATDGGDITLPMPVVDGGTGATTAAGARTNLGVETTAAATTLALFHFGGL